MTRNDETEDRFPVAASKARPTIEARRFKPTVLNHGRTRPSAVPGLFWAEQDRVVEHQAPGITTRG